MRLLHTSDLHLGRSLNGHDLSAAQGAFLDRIVDAAIDRAVDVVLIAGDVYDRTLPPVESVVAFESFLVRLHALGIPVVVISGNHDQAVRLGYGSALFQEGVHLLTDPARVQVPVELADEHGPVLVYGVPYLQPELTRRALSHPDGPELPATHEAVVGAAMARVRADLARRDGSPRVVVLAHAFVVGGEESPVVSTSERDVSVGGLQTVPSAVFAGAHYVALGHLHGPQQPRAVGTGALLRYSGSPLRYSISERDHSKSLTIVDLGPTGEVRVDEVLLPQPRPMADLRGTLVELLSDAHAHHRQSWVRLTITDSQRPDDLMRQLRDAFPHRVDVVFESARGHRAAASATVDHSSSPLDVAAEFIIAVRDVAMTDEERLLLGEVIAELEAGALAR